MPVIKLTDRNDLDRVLCEAMAHSFFPLPADGEKREAWVSSIIRDFAKNWTENLCPHPDYPDTNRRYQELLGIGRQDIVAPKIKDNENYDLNIAANILTSCAIHKHSRATAFEEMKERYKNDAGVTITENSALKKVKRAWKNYQNGCHFITAKILLHKWEINDSVVNNDFHSLTVIAFAEHLRKIAETEKHKNAQTSVLDARHTWKMPDDFALPEIEVRQDGMIRATVTLLTLEPV